MPLRFSPVTIIAVWYYLETASPDALHAAQARFLLGKAHMGLGNPDAAAAAFEITMQTCPETSEATESRYMLALVSLCQGPSDATLHHFASLARNPESPFSPEARMIHDYLKRRRLLVRNDTGG